MADKSDEARTVIAEELLDAPPALEPEQVKTQGAAPRVLGTGTTAN